MTSSSDNAMQPVWPLIKSAVQLLLSRIVPTLIVILILLIRAALPIAAAAGVMYLLKTKTVPHKEIITAVTIGLAAIAVMYAFALAYASLLLVYAKPTLNWKETSQEARKYIFPLMGTMLVSWFVIMAGITVFIVPGILFTIWFWFAPYAVIDEQYRGSEALWASRGLTRGHFFSLVFRLIAVMLISMVISLIPVVGQIVSFLMTPFWMAFGWLLYLDLKRVAGNTIPPVGDVFKSTVIALTWLVFLAYIVVLGYAIKSGKFTKFLSFGKTVAKITQIHSAPKQSENIPYLFTWELPVLDKASGFIGPDGIALDSAGHIYIADHFVYKYDVNGVLLTQWNEVEPGKTLFQPTGIAADVNGNIFLTDMWNRVLKYAPDGTHVTHWGEVGQELGKFSGPNGLAVDDKLTIYVADTNNNRIQKFDSAGNLLSSFGTKGTGPGQFEAPYDVAACNDGNLYVADSNNKRIQKFNMNGRFIRAWPVQIVDGDHQGTPYAVACDEQNAIYVADYFGSRILKFDNRGGYLGAWGVHGKDDGQINGPRDVAVNSQYVFIADYSNNRILRLSEGSPLHGPVPTLEPEGASDLVVATPSKPTKKLPKNKKGKKKKARR